MRHPYGLDASQTWPLPVVKDIPSYQPADNTPTQIIRAVPSEDTIPVLRSADRRAVPRTGASDTPVWAAAFVFVGLVMMVVAFGMLLVLYTHGV